MLDVEAGLPVAHIACDIGGIEASVIPTNREGSYRRTVNCIPRSVYDVRGRVDATRTSEAERLSGSLIATATVGLRPAADRSKLDAVLLASIASIRIPVGILTPVGTEREASKGGLS